MAVFFIASTIIYGLDLLDIRMEYSTINTLMQRWTIFMVIMSPVTAWLLLHKPTYGIIFFHFIAISQLVAHWAYPEIFGRSDVVVLFHIASLAAFWKIYASERRRHYESINK